MDVVERKNQTWTQEELCGSLCSRRKRFEAEFVRAIESGEKMLGIIENYTQNESQNGFNIK